VPQLATSLVVLALGLGLAILGGGLFALTKRAMIGYYTLKRQEPSQPGNYGLNQSHTAVAGPVDGEANQTSGAKNG